MIDPEHMSIVIEKSLRSGREVHRAKHHSDGTRIDPVEIDDLADQRAQCGGGDDRLLAAEADSSSALAEGQPASQRRPQPSGALRAPSRCRIAAHRSPELPKPQCPFVRQIPGDDRGVDRADGGAGDPVRPYSAFLKRREQAPAW